MNSVALLGIRIDQITRTKLPNIFRDYFDTPGQFAVFTPNSEMMVETQRDATFRDILNTGALNLCDTMGVALASRVLYPYQKLERVTGMDALDDLLAFAAHEQKTVFLLGAEYSETVTKAKVQAEKKFPGIRITGVHPGPSMWFSYDDVGSHLHIEKKINDAAIDQIIDEAPDILVVAFGQHKQERWIHQYLKQLPSVKIAIGVGQGIDVLAGKVTRAPKILQQIGLAWVWRFATHPWRIKRIWHATVIFTWYVLVAMAKERGQKISS